MFKFTTTAILLFSSLFLLGGCSSNPASDTSPETRAAEGRCHKCDCTKYTQAGNKCICGHGFNDHHN